MTGAGFGNTVAHAASGVAYSTSYASRICRWTLLGCPAVHMVSYLLWHAAAGNAAAEHFLFAEDRLIETLSAVTFLAAGVLGIAAARVRRGLARLDRLALLLIGLTGIAGFLDEVSFGERVFGFQAYRIAGIKIDALHDFSDVAHTLRYEMFGPMSLAAKVLAVGIGACGLAAVAGVVWRRFAADRWRYRWRAPGVIVLAVLFVAELGLSTLIDLRTLTFAGAYSVEETAELCAAIALAAMVAIIGRPEKGANS